jgi:hypothetical protein
MTRLLLGVLTSLALASGTVRAQEGSSLDEAKARFLAFAVGFNEAALRAANDCDDMTFEMYDFILSNQEDMLTMSAVLREHPEAMGDQVFRAAAVDALREVTVTIEGCGDEPRIRELMSAYQRIVVHGERWMQVRVEEVPLGDGVDP